MADNIVCPKCRTEQKVDVVSSDFLHCQKCDEPMYVNVDFVIDYSVECVNHDWSVWRASQDGEWWFRFCGACDKCESSRHPPEEVTS